MRSYTFFDIRHQIEILVFFVHTRSYGSLFPSLYYFIDTMNMSAVYVNKNAFRIDRTALKKFTVKSSQIYFKRFPLVTKAMHR